MNLDNDSDNDNEFDVMTLMMTVGIKHPSFTQVSKVVTKISD